MWNRRDDMRNSFILYYYIFTLSLQHIILGLSKCINSGISNRPTNNNYNAVFGPVPFHSDGGGGGAKKPKQQQRKMFDEEVWVPMHW